MKLPHRRQLLHLAAGAAALPALSRVARAQAYPARPVRIIAGYPAGGSVDFHARVIGQWLSERFRQPFVIDNRPGAGGNVGTEAVVRARADGYTLLLVAPANVINATLYNNLNFDFVRDIAPVASIVRTGLVMVVNPSFSSNTIPEFVEFAKTNPAKLNMASSGNGTAGHLAGELFKMMTGVNVLHVPYRGEAPALSDVMSGQVQVMFVSLAPSLELIMAGKLRALAVTTSTRLASLPDVPCVSEAIPGYEANGFVGIGAPERTPRDIIAKLNGEINAGLRNPSIKARYEGLGYTMFGGSPADFGRFLADETEKWGKVIRFAGIKAE